MANKLVKLLALLDDRLPVSTEEIDWSGFEFFEFVDLSQPPFMFIRCMPLPGDKKVPPE